MFVVSSVQCYCKAIWPVHQNVLIAECVILAGLVLVHLVSKLSILPSPAKEIGDVFRGMIISADSFEFPVSARHLLIDA